MHAPAPVAAAAVAAGAGSQGAALQHFQQQHGILLEPAPAAAANPAPPQMLTSCVHQHQLPLPLPPAVRPGPAAVGFLLPAAWTALVSAGHPYPRVPAQVLLVWPAAVPAATARAQQQRPAGWTRRRWWPPPPAASSAAAAGTPPAARAQWRSGWMPRAQRWQQRRPRAAAGAAASARAPWRGRPCLQQRPPATARPTASVQAGLAACAPSPRGQTPGNWQMQRVPAPPQAAVAGQLLQHHEQPAWRLVRQTQPAGHLQDQQRAVRLLPAAAAACAGGGGEAVG
mmetsp:Transcript_901/g.2407  ORF Transcript_901/g.2407 Transcript_901/m.2407 type:complete len:284 (+) Transcript_901:462-1313(+)